MVIIRARTLGRANHCRALPKAQAIILLTYNKPSGPSPLDLNLKQNLQDNCTAFLAVILFRTKGSIIAFLPVKWFIRVSLVCD